MKLDLLSVLTGLTFSSLWSHHVQAFSQIANDPPSYFGGEDNQAYLNWVDTISDNYAQSMYVPSSISSKGVAVHWSISDDHEWLEIAVAAPASGWVGFGISELGGMYGSDMAIYAKKRPTEILDAHVVEIAYPQVDNCQQDWIYVNHSSTAESEATARQAGTTDFLMFEARRKLDTGDPQDKQIGPDGDPFVPATRVIAAWGDQEDYVFHGPKAARGAIRFHGEFDIPEEQAFVETVGANSDGSFFIGAEDYTIPPDRTTIYMDFCFTRADLIAMGVPDTSDAMSVIGFEPLVSEGSIGLVHHYIVSGLTSSSDTACEDENPNAMVYVWAPGNRPYALADNLGIPLFGAGGFQGFNIEIHYDNPTFKAGVVDNSGVKMFFTTQAREIEVGVLSIADPVVELNRRPISDGLSQHTFECAPSCSSFFLPEGESVTVIREHLHMHQMGTRMTNEVIRDGETIHSASIEVWDFNNGNSPVQQKAYEIKPGDGFRTTCFYETSKALDSTPPAFGLKSENEMCIAFLYYYPRKAFEFPGGQAPWTCGVGFDAFEGACKSSYDEVVDLTESDVNRVFGASVCNPADNVPTESTSSATSMMQVAKSLSSVVAMAMLTLV